jgi:hypothetical protein
MGRKKDEKPEKLSPEDLDYVRAVREAELAIQQQESRVTAAAAKLRAEREEYRNRVRSLRNIANELPLFDKKD